MIFTSIETMCITFSATPEISNEFFKVFDITSSATLYMFTQETVTSVSQQSRKEERVFYAVCTKQQ
jgi:hypothetical protein